jgi:murein DD-endopeptidase MepM/ murein hydrolase activator NlpD
MGIDYSAPTGTPVHAAGSGRVEFVGWKNGFGKFVEINHGSQYSTMYGHLSRFSPAIRAGMNVKQGQLIGYVGATGLATGPHLHYQVSRRGVLVNPLGLKFRPNIPLRPEYLAAFETNRQKWQAQFVRLDFASAPHQMLVASLSGTGNR